MVFYQSNRKVTNTAPKSLLSINFPQNYIITDKRTSKIIKSTAKGNAEEGIKTTTTVFLPNITSNVHTLFLFWVGERIGSCYSTG